MASFVIYDQIKAKTQLAYLITVPQLKNGIPPSPLKSFSANALFIQQLSEEERNACEDGTLAIVFDDLDVVDSDTEESVRKLLQERANRVELEYLSNYKERGRFVGLRP